MLVSLLVAALCFQIHFCLAQESCSANGNRVNCGYVGIDQGECESRLCCWNEVNPNPNNLPWCFYQNGANPQPPICDASRSRVDCGYDGITQEECQQRECCWNELNPNPGNQPWCFFSNPVLPGYQMESIADTTTGYLIVITARSDNTYNPYGQNISPLNIQIDFETESRLHLKIYDPNSERWEVPPSIFPRPVVTEKAPNPNYSFSYTENPFGFAIVRNNDGVVVFNSSITDLQTCPYNGLQYADQYLEISTQFSSANPNIYGFMESTQPTGIKLQTNGNAYTLWNIDTPSSTTNQNLYGSHPFFLSMDGNGNAHGVFLLNSNGMDIIANPTSLTYKVIGGVLDFYFFMGPSPDEVVSQYCQVIGNPHLPPYWSLGFHQSKYGYPNIWFVEQVVANYSAAKIPLDTIWSDIDYMDAYKDFTWDPVNYPVDVVLNFTNQLHANGQYYVPIVDPGIASTVPGYTPYQDLINAKAYIYDSNGNPFVGQVWPGYTIFTDFLNPDAYNYWYSQVSQFLSTVPYDGLWIDMNEISNFCTGECLPPNSTSTPAKSPRNKRDDSFNPQYPPYSINNQASHSPLNTKTLDMTAVHYNNTLEYNCHNLYGFTESINTKEALEQFYNRRAFVLSRSTFAGSGHHVAHWTGDNTSAWSNLYYAIVGMLNFNMLGIPFIGSDICGFNGDTTMELCTRWIEFGAFSPFCRDHDTEGATYQELYRWPQTTNASRVALGIRYSVLPLYYTLFYHANVNGTPVARPMMFQYPTDPTTYSLDTQFLIGDNLMIIPVITEGATTVNGYFPNDVWYDYYNQTRVHYSGNTVLNAPLEFVNVFVRGGSITPYQHPNLTTTATRKNPMNLLVALNNTGSAKGRLFWDDGLSITSVPNNQYLYLDLVSKSNSVTSSVLVNGYQSGLVWDSVTVLGVTSAPNAVTLNGKAVSYQYNNTKNVLTVKQIGIPLQQGFNIQWN